MSVIWQLSNTPAAVLSQKYSITRTTVLSWEKQLPVHLKNEKGVDRAQLPYPKEVAKISEWILARRDIHLPVAPELINSKENVLIKQQNPRFKASKGWLESFYELAFTFFHE